MINIPLFRDRLSQLIAQPSVSCTAPQWDMSNEAVIALLASWLEGLDFKVDIQPVTDHPGKQNLIATLGTGSGGLILGGHSDTVPCDPDRWEQDPYQLQERDDRFYGLGATDMKGFFPTALAAIESIDNLAKKIKRPLIILATADEESSMSGARALAQAKALKADYAIIGEPTGMKPVRMHKGIMMESIRVQGLAGHSSNPLLGHNALETMHAILGELIRYRQELQAHHTHPGFDIDIPTLNLGAIHGGDNPNRICGHCELHFDLRPLPGMNNAELRDAIDKRLRPLEDIFKTPISLVPLFPGVDAYEESQSSALVQAAEKFTGTQAESVAFATEAPFIQSLGTQTLVMGPGSIDQAHQPNEYLAQSQLKPATQILRDLIGRFCL